MIKLTFKYMWKVIEEHLFQILLAVVTTGAVPTIAYWWFNRGKTKASVHKAENEAALVLVDGWKGMVQELKEEGRLREERCEKRIKDFEEKMKSKEDWYIANLAEKDKKIESLQHELFTLNKRLARYEGMQKRMDYAKDEIHHVVEETIENAKSPTDKPPVAG